MDKVNELKRGALRTFYFCGHNKSHANVSRSGESLPRTNQLGTNRSGDVNCLKIPARRSREQREREKTSVNIAYIDIRLSRIGRVGRAEGFNSHVSSTRISGEITSSVAAHIARYSAHPKESSLDRRAWDYNNSFPSRRARLQKEISLPCNGSTLVSSRLKCTRQSRKPSRIFFYGLLWTGPTLVGLREIDLTFPMSRTKIHNRFSLRRRERKDRR